MIIDYLMEFTPAEGQALSAAAASEHRIDFGQEAPSTGLDYDRLGVVVTVKSAVSGTLKVSLQDSDSETSGYADCVTGLQLTAPAEGTQIYLPLPSRHKRYMQVYFGGSPTAGTVHAFVTSGVQDNVPPKQAASLDGIG